MGEEEKLKGFERGNVGGDGAREGVRFETEKAELVEEEERGEERMGVGGEGEILEDEASDAAGGAGDSRPGRRTGAG